MRIAITDSRKKIVSGLIYALIVASQLFLVPRVSFLAGNINLMLACVVALSFASSNKTQFSLCLIFGLIFDLTQQKVFGLAMFLFVLTNVVAVFFKGRMAQQGPSAGAILSAIISIFVTVIYLLVIAITTQGVGFFELIVNGGIAQIVLNALFTALLFVVFSFIHRDEDSGFMYAQF